MIRRLALAAAAVALASPACRAEVLCISTAAQLRSALVTAANSPSATEIRLHPGFYSVPAANGSAVSLSYSANSDLSISGGWRDVGGSCATQGGSPSDTVLSAAGVGQLFDVFLQTGAATRFEISNLSLRQGDLSNGGGASACLAIETDGSSDATVLIDRNEFRLCNRVGGSGSALALTARSATVYVRGNVFADNGNTSGAVLLKSLGGSIGYVSNNTIANNPQFGIGGGPGGLQITGLASDFYWITNNVLWNNGTGNGYDLLATAPAEALLYNLVGQMAPLPAGTADINNLGVDPGFTSLIDFHPRADSPLRNSGVNPSGGIIAVDFDDLPRIAGSKIDRGAYEFGELFGNGFE